MRAFLDTEFTHLDRPELIAIGIVTEAGEEFYAETDFQLLSCSCFVRETVVPLLQHMPIPKAILAVSLRSWLENFTDPILMFDSKHDGILFNNLFCDSPPPAQGILLQLDQWGWRRVGCAIDAYFLSHPDEHRHHALADARALREAWKQTLY